MPSVLLRRGQHAGVAFWLCLASCASRSFEAPTAAPEAEVTKSSVINAFRGLDILFMIDNSLSMEQEQTKLRENFPVFIDELRKIEGGIPDIHVAVVSSDMGAGPSDKACVRPGGDLGRFRIKPGCGLPPEAQFIKSYDRGAKNNFDTSKTLEEVFSCIADLGTQGCGYEHQLQSVSVALSNFNASNQGFLRPDAFLAIILITDEDDCSADPQSDLFTDPQFSIAQASSLKCNLAGHACNGMPLIASEFQTPLANCSATSGGRLINISKLVDQIKSYKSNPDQQIFVSAITGKPAEPTDAAYAFATFKDSEDKPVLDVKPICAANGGTAAPALRLTAFVNAFGSRGTLESICSDDFRGPLSRIGQQIAAGLKPICVYDNLLDTEPAVDGLQADCTVEEEIPASDGSQKVLIPVCAAGLQGACWNLLPPNAAGNPCLARYAIDVNRYGTTPDPGTLQSIRCRTCAKSSDPRCL